MWSVLCQILSNANSCIVCETHCGQRLLTLWSHRRLWLEETHCGQRLTLWLKRLTLWLEETHCGQRRLTLVRGDTLWLQRKLTLWLEQTYTVVRGDIVVAETAILFLVQETVTLWLKRRFRVFLITVEIVTFVSAYMLHCILSYKGVPCAVQIALSMPDLHHIRVFNYLGIWWTQLLAQELGCHILVIE